MPFDIVRREGGRVQHAPLYVRICCYAKTSSPTRRGTELRPFQFIEGSLPSPVIPERDTPIIVRMKRWKPSPGAIVRYVARCHSKHAPLSRSVYTHHHVARFLLRRSASRINRIQPSFHFCCLHADVCRDSGRDSVIVTPGDIHLASLLSDLGRVTHRRADCSVSAMVPNCFTCAENDDEHRELSSVFRGRVAAAGHQLVPVPAGLGGCADAAVTSVGPNYWER